MRVPLALTLMSSLSACGGGGETTGFGGLGRPGDTDEPGSSQGPAESSTSGPGMGGSGSTSGGAASTSPGSSEDVVWDMGAPDIGTLQPAGCGGKIDFLFVISASGTMKPEQERLVASFPGFMHAIEAQYPGFDHHILVANTATKWAIQDCGVCNDDCDPEGEPPYCGAELTICDKKLGAGITFPEGPAASNRRCELDSGLRYITAGQQDLDDAFACIAQVGMGGGGYIAQAMVEALRPEINDPTDEDACNRGFLRDDALLVVTIISDVYDEDSQWSVEEWISALRTAKHDDDDAFAVLVLTTDMDVGYGQLCHPDIFDKNKNRLRLLAEGVEHGFIDSICLESYVPFFSQHVGALVEICDEFVPPG